MPGDSIDEGPALRVDEVHLGTVQPTWHYMAKKDGDETDNDTALVVNLPRPIVQGESVTLDVEFTLNLPQKQGRWGQWDGVTFLAQWLPVVAFYDEKGWQPTPFIPWHQPFFNEAGNYQVRVTLPADQKIGHSGTVVSSKDIAGGLREVEISAPAVRDFAFVCCARFQEWTEMVRAFAPSP